MSLFDSIRRDEATGDAGKPVVSDNPLLAFGSEGEPENVAVWKPSDVRASSPRLAEMSWRADQPEQDQAGPRPSTLQRLLIPGLLSACVAVGAAIYTEPIYNPPDPPEVAHPFRSALLIKPIPPPPRVRALTPVAPSAAPAPAAPTPAARGQASVIRGQVAVTRGQAPVTRSQTPVTRAGTPAARPPAAQASAAQASQATTAARPAGPLSAPGFGSLSVNARPWADIWIDGQSAGQTPIANIQLRIGSHEIIFRHPQLGERRQTVQVDGVNPTRISIDLRK